MQIYSKIKYDVKHMAKVWTIESYGDLRKNNFGMIVYHNV